jgi:hypothetical protein
MVVVGGKGKVLMPNAEQYAAFTGSEGPCSQVTQNNDTAD